MWLPPTKGPNYRAIVRQLWPFRNDPDWRIRLVVRMNLREALRRAG